MCRSKGVALCQDGYNFFQHKDSRGVLPEDQAKTKEQKAEREKALKEGKLAPEVFDRSFGETPKAFYAEGEKNLDACLATLKSLDEAVRREVRRCGALVRQTEDRPRTKSAVWFMVFSRRSGSSSRIRWRKYRANVKGGARPAQVRQPRPGRRNRGRVSI